MATSLTAKEIADQLSLAVGTVQARIYVLRKEAKQAGWPCNDFVPPYTEATLEAVANYGIRDVPNPNPRGTHANRKHCIERDNKKFYEAFFPNYESVANLNRTEIKCSDGTAITGAKAMYRWISMNKPKVDTPEEIEKVRSIIFCSVDTKTFNKAKKAGGYKKIKSQSAYSYVIDDCFRCFNDDDEALKAWKKDNVRKAKELQKELGCDWQRAQAEYLLSEKMIDHDTFWHAVDRLAEKKYNDFANLMRTLDNYESVLTATIKDKGERRKKNEQ